MHLTEFIEMMRAIDVGRELEVGFQLQHNSEGGLTIQDIGGRCGYRRVAEFFERVAAAAPPCYLPAEAPADGGPEAKGV